MTYEPLERCALHDSAPTSEPAPGSLIPIASTLPETMPLSIASFCSSVPKRW